MSDARSAVSDLVNAVNVRIGRAGAAETTAVPADLRVLLEELAEASEAHDSLAARALADASLYDEFALANVRMMRAASVLASWTRAGGSTVSKWHERVARCTDCPFMWIGHLTGDPYCATDRTSANRRIEPPFEAADAPAPPEWCPLRAGPRTVALAGSKDGGR